MSEFSELDNSLMKAAKETYIPILKAELVKQPLVADRLGIAQKGKGTVRFTIKE